MDLNIVCRDLISGENVKEQELIQTVRTAFKLGYEVVALNTIVGPEQLEAKGSKIPDPVVVSLGSDDLPEVTIAGKKFQILSRLTAVVSDNNHCAKLTRSPVFNKYDIVAVDPQNLKVFQHICSSIEVDLISFDMTNKPSFHWKSNNLKQATSRGISFEVQYAPCLRGQESCRFTIAAGSLMNEVLRGKDIIVSSGAKKAIELRGPLDVSYLAHGVFGLKEEQAKASVRSNCRKVILRSEIRRKTGKGIVSVQELSELQEGDKWLREACTLVVNVVKQSTKRELSGTSSSEDDDEDSPDIPTPKRSKKAVQ